MAWHDDDRLRWQWQFDLVIKVTDHGAPRDPVLAELPWRRGRPDTLLASMLPWHSEQGAYIQPRFNINKLYTMLNGSHESRTKLLGYLDLTDASHAVRAFGMTLAAVERKSS